MLVIVISFRLPELLLGVDIACCTKNMFYGPEETADWKFVEKKSHKVRVTALRQQHLFFHNWSMRVSQIFKLGCIRRLNRGM